jgi:signal transduction histidine kinase
MAERRWALAPLQGLLLATLVLLAAVGLALWLTLRGPSLGMELKAAGERGVRVVAVSPDGPAAGVLDVGDVIQALSSARGHHQLAGFDPISQPHAEPTFAAYNAYLEKEQAVYHSLQAGPVTLHLESGQRVSLTPADQRPVASLPLAFWLLHLYGALACLIGLSVWVFMPRYWPARLLALSGLGMFLATWQHSLWESRELVLPGALFDVLMRGNHLAMYLLFTTLTALLVIYPRRTPGGRWIIAGVVVVMTALQLNENLQGVDLPLHTFYLPMLLFYPLGLGLMAAQWRLTRSRPTERGALRWVFLSILITMGMGLVVYFLPVALDLPPVAHPSTMVGLVVTLYIGFALGILRYRLFQLERWWFMAWAWFLGGLAVLLVDVAVISASGLNQAEALALAVIIVGWVYFPVRQWLWRRLAASSEANMERHIPAFVESLYTCDPEQVGTLWRDLLREVFQPLSLASADRPVADVALAGNGARLMIPALDDGDGLCLLYGQGGRRLFGRRDKDIAAALVATGSRLYNARRAREAGAAQERGRIMRDLHDDVGGRLLTLIQKAPDPHHAQLARNAMSSLRHAIQALDPNRRRSLRELLEDWLGDSVERLPRNEPLAAVTLPDETDHIELTPRHYVNLRRVLDEALTNALKHGQPGTLRFGLAVEDAGVRLRLSNDIAGCGEANHDPSGYGLGNLRTRMEELNGELILHREPGPPPRFCVEARLTL